MKSNVDWSLHTIPDGDRNFRVMRTQAVLADGREASFEIDADLAAIQHPDWPDEQLQHFIQEVEP